MNDWYTSILRVMYFFKGAFDYYDLVFMPYYHFNNVCKYANDFSKELEKEVKDQMK